MLTVKDLHEAFMELGTRARDEGKVIDFAASFYPEAKISARLRLGIRELWRVKDTPTQEGRHVTPTYLGRGRPSS